MIEIGGIGSTCVCGETMHRLFEASFGGERLRACACRNNHYHLYHRERRDNLPLVDYGVASEAMWSAIATQLKVSKGKIMPAILVTLDAP